MAAAASRYTYTLYIYIRVFYIYICTRDALGKVRSPARSDPKLRSSRIRVWREGRASAGRIYGDHRHPKGSLASGGHVYFSLSHSARNPPPSPPSTLQNTTTLYYIL